MKRIQILAAVLLFAWTMNAQTALDEAKKKIVNENFSEAKGLLDKFIAGEKDPNKQAEAYFWLGECDYQSYVDNNPEKAVNAARDQYNKGLVLSKNNAHCQVGMGKLLLLKKNEKEALKTFDSAIRASKAKPYKEGHPDIFMLIGDAYMEVKNFEQADANYTRAHDIEIKSAVAYIKMGDAKLAKGDAGSAVSAYENALQKDPKNPEVYLKLAVIWQRATKLDFAIARCEEGVKVDPDYAPLYKLLAELHYANGNFDKVTGDLDRYLSKTKIEDPDARLRFIKFLTYSAKDYTRAIAEATKFAGTSAEQYPTVYRWLAWANFEKGLLLEKGKEKDKATGSFGDDWKMLMEESNKASKMLFAKLPVDRVVDYDYNYAARAAHKLGNMEDAIKWYEEVIKLDSTQTCTIMSSIAQTYLDQKKFKEFLQYIDQKAAKGCKMTYVDYYNAMHYSIYITKEYERGVKYTDKYIEIVPTGADGYSYKGLAQSLTDTIEPQKWLAKEAYEKLIQLYEAKPDDARAKGYVGTAYNYLGSYFGMQQDLVKAKELFQKVLAIDPKNKTALAAMEQLNGLPTGNK